ncbi:MAG: hypothetical protein ACRD9R_15600 [Pyrinomonadaceae bacterium]
MTSEEMERAIEFLLRHQADLDASQSRTDQQLQTNARQIAEVTGQVTELARGQARTQQQLDHVIQVIHSVAEQTQQNRTDIDVLAKIVNRLVEQNGGV